LNREEQQKMEQGDGNVLIDEKAIVADVPPLPLTQH
jgi:hypothetical protein